MDRRDSNSRPSTGDVPPCLYAVDVTERRINPSEWTTAVDAEDGRQLVVGGPGTGKTEFLVRRAVSLIDKGLPPDDLLLLSFSRRGVADLRSRLRERLRRTGISIPAMTFHALAARILEATTVVPALLTGPEQVALVHRLLLREDPNEWPVSFRPLLATDAFATEVTDFLLRCSEQLIEPDELRRSERSDWRAMPGLLERYRDFLAHEGRIDYGTLLVEAIRMIDNDATIVPYRYVLVDEYQDTTAAQAGLLDRLSTGNITVAADPYQSIYSFRGTDLNNVERFSRTAQRLVLTTSFRVPSHILAAAERVVAGGSLPGAGGPVEPAPGTGSVETYRFTQQSEEAEWIAREIHRLHLEQSYPYAAIAVFVRSKRRFLPELSRALERRGIPHDQPDSRLVDHPAVRTLFDCALAATSTGKARDAAVRRILLGRLFELSLGRMRELEQHHISLPWADVIRTGVPDGRPLARLIEDPAWATEVPAIDGLWEVWTELPQMIPVAKEPGRMGERAALTSLAQVLGRLADRDPAMSLDGYRRMATEEDFEATPLLSYRSPNEDRLTLTTLHQSKGLQFDFVFIADAVEGTFPDLRPRESLLGSRHLNASLPEDTPGYLRFRLQEEMRLAYTAMSRARRRVVWTCTSRGFDEGRGMPSRFIASVAGADTVEEALGRPTADNTPVTPLEGEAWLRAIAGDPAEASARRAAAMSLLIDGSTWGMRPWRRFAGTAPRGPDTGLVGERLIMSPSRAEAYLTCPRRFAFERLLHVGGDPSTYALLGLVIHEVLERVERAAMERGDRHATLDEALAYLSTRWESEQFGGAPWADSWKRRAAFILERLYTQWPGSGDPVLIERDLTLEVDGIQWRGRVDRVERRDAGLTVVDYKTSATPSSIGDAAASIQLGFYAMATEDTLGEVVAGGEMWFPANKQQKKVPVRSLDINRMGEIRELMRLASVGVRSEEWMPLPSKACDRCSIRLVCPEWPEGQEAFAR